MYRSKSSAAWPKLVTGYEDQELDTDDSDYSQARRITSLLTLLRGILLNHHVSLVQTKYEARDSQRLLYREYLNRGLCEANFSQLYFNHYTFLRSTKTFISCRGQKIVGTLMLIGDGEFGIPSDNYFPNELKSLREQQYRLLEIGELALDHRVFGKHSPKVGIVRNVAALTSLFCGVLNYIQEYSDATHLVMLANPKHKSLYKYLGFVQFAEEKPLSPEETTRVPMILNLSRFFNSAAHHPPAYLAEQCRKILTPQRSYHYTDEDLIARAEFNKDFVRSLTRWQIEILSKEYPLAGKTLQRLHNGEGSDESIGHSNTCKPEFFSNTFSIEQMFIIDNQYKAKHSLAQRIASKLRM